MVSVHTLSSWVKKIPCGSFEDFGNAHGVGFGMQMAIPLLDASKGKKWGDKRMNVGIQHSQIKMLDGLKHSLFHHLDLCSNSPLASSRRIRVSFHGLLPIPSPSLQPFLLSIHNELILLKNNKLKCLVRLHKLIVLAFCLFV